MYVIYFVWLFGWLVWFGFFGDFFRGWLFFWDFLLFQTFLFFQTGLRMWKAERGRREDLIYIELLLCFLRFQPKEKSCWQVSSVLKYNFLIHNVFISPLLHLLFLCMVVPEVYLLFMSSLIKLSISFLNTHENWLLYSTTDAAQYLWIFSFLFYKHCVFMAIFENLTWAHQTCKVGERVSSFTKGFLAHF